MAAVSGRVAAAFYEQSLFLRKSGIASSDGILHFLPPPFRGLSLCSHIFAQSPVRHLIDSRLQLPFIGQAPHASFLRHGARWDFRFYCVARDHVAGITQRAGIQKILNPDSTVEWRSENNVDCLAVTESELLDVRGDIHDEVEKLQQGKAIGDWIQSHSLMKCCEPNKKLRVAVLLSGGVDSSVALRLLEAAGHKCTAFYLKIWFQEDFQNFWSECPWEEDLKYAQAVCDQVGVELRVVHMTDEYWGRVVKHSVTEIKAGRTPNPDILCNSRIKFGAFYDHISFSEFDRVASGHYARLEYINLEVDLPRVRLFSSPDQVKDQTYFLSHLSQEQLQRAMFPLGALPKAEVRQLAKAMALPNKSRKDSQGICFLGKVKFSEFVGMHLGEVRGRLLDAESGELLGHHRGFWFHTIGQRQGLGLSGGPWYVVAKDLENNVVFVSRAYYSPDKSRRIFRAGGFSWIAGHPPPPSAHLLCKVRHGPSLVCCKVSFQGTTEGQAEPDAGVSWFDASASHQEAGQDVGGAWASGKDRIEPDTAVITLEEDDQGLAAGQYAALYQDNECLGAGIILEALELSSSGIPSIQAKEAAKMSEEEQLALTMSNRQKKKAARRRLLEEANAALV